MGVNDPRDGILRMSPIKLLVWAVCFEVLQVEPDFITHLKLWCWLPVAVGVLFLCLLCYSDGSFCPVPGINKLLDYLFTACFRGQLCILIPFFQLFIDLYRINIVAMHHKKGADAC